MNLRSRAVRSLEKSGPAGPSDRCSFAMQGRVDAPKGTQARGARRSRGGKLVFSFGRAHKLSDGDVTVVKTSVRDPRIMIIAIEKSRSAPPSPPSSGILFPAGERPIVIAAVRLHHSAAMINRRRRSEKRASGHDWPRRPRRIGSSRRGIDVAT